MVDEVAGAAVEIADLLVLREASAVILVFASSAAQGLGTIGRVVAALHAQVPLSWHHVRLHGLDIPARLPQGAAHFVWGFEEVEPEERLEALVTLNRGRDLLRVTGTRLVLVLPASLRQAVHDRCADLLAWRDLVLELPEDGTGAEAVLPPWALVRDIAARRAVAVVGPWLAGPEHELTRRLLPRMGWAGLVDIGEEALLAGGDWEVVEPSSFHQLYLRTDRTFYARIPADGVVEENPWSRSPHERLLQCWRVGSGPLHHSSLEKLPSLPEGDVLVQLGLLYLLSARPFPPFMVPAVRPAHAVSCSEAGNTLVLGPEPWVTDDMPWSEDLPEALWLADQEGVAQAWQVSETERGEASLFDRRLRDLLDHDPDKAWLLERMLVAFGLDTTSPHPWLAELLGESFRAVVVTGYDLFVEATLWALDVPFRVVAIDEDIVESQDEGLLVLRPWGDPLRPATLRPFYGDLEQALAESPALNALLAAALDQRCLWFGFPPSDIRFLVLLERRGRGPHLVAPGLPFHRAEAQSLEERGIEVAAVSRYGWKEYGKWSQAGLYAWLSSPVPAPEVVVEPPYPLPEEPWSYLHELEPGGRVGGEYSSLGAALAEYPKLRVVGAALAGKTEFARFAAWASRSRRSHLFYRLQKLPGPIRYFDLEQGIDWSMLDGAEADELLLLDQAHALAREERERLSAWVDGAGCRVAVFDRPGIPWPSSSAAAIFEVSSRYKMPEAMAGWAVQASPAMQAALPSLRVRSEEHDGIGTALRTPFVLRELAASARDPFDPLGPKLAADALRISFGASYPACGHDLDVQELLFRGKRPRRRAESELEYLSRSIAPRAPGLFVPDEIESIARPQDRQFLRVLLAELSSLQESSYTAWERAMGLLVRQRFPLHALLEERLPWALQTAGLLLRARPLEDADPALLTRILTAASAEPVLLAWLQATCHFPEERHALAAGSTLLSAFSMDILPVTRARYKVFVEAGGYQRQDLWSAEGWRWKEEEGVTGPAEFPDEVPGDPAMPRTGVSWHEAAAFARWRGGVLPTEVQWEVAALDGVRGGAREGLRPVGWDIDPEQAEWRCLDLGGNALEWCGDWFDALYPDVAPRTDPKGPSRGLERAARGPAWWVSGEAARSPAKRWHFHPGTRRPDLGFRLCRARRG